MEFQPQYPPEMNAQYAMGDNYLPAVANQEYVEIQSIIADGGDRFGVSAVTFDTQEELLWMGNSGGHVTSYYGPDMQKYTSFQVHMTNEIRQILPIDTGILSLTKNDVKCSHRRGLVKFNFNSEKMKNMQCMLVTGHGRLLMGGHQDDLLMLDLEKKEIIKSIPIEEGNCAILRHHPRYICSGDTSGKISLRDPTTFKAEHTLQAHNGCLSDFDVSGNMLVTAGFSQRMGNLTMDRFLKVYDLRQMRAVTPIQLMFDPLLLKFMSTYSSRLAVCSQTGQFQLVEGDGVMTSQSMVMYQVNTAGMQCLSFDCSSTCQAFSFGDAGGYVHLFGTNNGITFNPYSKPTEFADPVEPVHPIHINDELTPLSSVPMPICRTGKLLSDWPEDLLKCTYRQATKIRQEILNSMKVVQSIGYAPKPANMKCNQVPYKLSSDSGKDGGNRRSRQHSVPESPVGRESNAVIIPKRYMKVEVKYTKLGLNDFDFNRYNKTCFSGLEAILPNAYCNCMLQVLFFIEPIRCSLLNHLCDKDFCLSCELGFLFHMLDTSKGLPCQASNFLRTFRSIPEGAALGLVLPEDDEALRKNLNFRRLIQSWNRFILSQLNSEMMRKKVVSTKAETHSEDEAESEEKHDSSTGIQRRRYNSGEETESRHQDKLKKSTKSTGNAQTPISKIFGMKTVTKNTCRCGLERTQSSLVFLSFLFYSEAEGIGNGPDEPIPLFSFTSILQKSLCLEQTMQAWCESCNKYQTTVQTKCLKNLPEILVVNCGLETPQNLRLWKAQLETKDAGAAQREAAKITKQCRYGNSCNKPNCKFYHETDKENGEKSENDDDDSQSEAPWLPTFIKMKIDSNGKAVVKECTTEESEGTSAELDDDFVLYELTSVTSHVIDPLFKGKDNLVSCIKVGSSYHRRTGAMVSEDLKQWYLFNDFSVNPITKEEAVWMALDWKIPCFLYYSRKDLEKRNKVEVKTPFSSSVFDDDTSLAAKASQKVTFTPLTRDETPAEGELIAMDAEFVTINQEEAVLRSDGTRSTIKPCQMSVARITCIRGHGDKEGVPFIDDYISTQEQVVDYLTQFSGIKPGDLDVSVSSKHLTTLKSTYKKLRYLADTKVHFVGHGLKNDFRVINLVVPPEQVHDTVLLFKLPNHRLISLRFLAWHFLGLKIQSVTHDSIEDAKTALKLYRKYQRLDAEGKMKEVLKELYDIGYKMQWKVPEDDNC